MAPDKVDFAFLFIKREGERWKKKENVLIVDAVLLYAQKRPANHATYTFAVWEGDQLVPFAKADSGLTEQELDEIDCFIKAHTIEKFGPVRSVKPELVFEIAFESIQLSKRHKSGVVVNFPRIQRWYRDKKPEEADTIETLKTLISISD